MIRSIHILIHTICFVNYRDTDNPQQIYTNKISRAAILFRSKFFILHYDCAIDFSIAYINIFVYLGH